MYLGMVKTWSRQPANVRIRIKKKGDLRDFENGVIVGASAVCLRIYSQKLQICWDFLTQLSLGFAGNSLKNRKHPVSGSCLGENTVLMADVRGE